MGAVGRRLGDTWTGFILTAATGTTTEVEEDGTITEVDVKEEGTTTGTTPEVEEEGTTTEVEVKGAGRAKT